MDRIRVTLLLCVLAVACVCGQDDNGGYEDVMKFSIQLAQQTHQQDFNIKDYQRLMRLRHLAVEFFDYYQNLTVKDLVPETRLENEQDLQCLAEVTELSKGLSSGSVWALKMIDSWGNLPSGILHGNLKDLGNYDECLRINHPITKTANNLRGKYCLAKVLSSDQLGVNLGINAAVKTAVCFPASCTGEQIEILLRNLFKALLDFEIDANIKVINDMQCQTAEADPLDGLTIFTIVLLSILLAIMVGCTIYDYFFCENQEHLPKLVKVFSGRVNSRALFRIVNNQSNPNVIESLNGMRCLSLIWVIYGHGYMISSFAPNINMVDILTWYRSPYSMFIMHALFSVDTFFFISGLLLVMISLRTMERAKGKLNIPLMYLHRYLRLTPVLAIGILVYMTILPILGNGPVYSSLANESKRTCADTWFWTLLYVQNYATKQMCLPHSWYLGVDMQLYIISPIILIGLYKWGKKAVAGLVVLMLLLTSCLFSMMVIKGYSIANFSLNTNKIYFTTHTRASPWIIGILFGYFLHVNREKSFKLNRLTIWLGWIISLGLIFICLFAVYPYPANAKHLPIVNEAFYVSLTRIAWPLALVWVVFACKYGYGGMANSFLSSLLWQPLSKLSYCAYIFHLMIESLNGAITHTNTYFSDYQLMTRFWSDFGFTLLFAYLMYILIEAPFGGLEMLLFPKRSPRPQPAIPPQPKLPSPLPDQEFYIVSPPLQIKTVVDT